MRCADRVSGLGKGFRGVEGPFMVRMSIDPVVFLSNMSDLPSPLKSPMQLRGDQEREREREGGAKPARRTPIT
jgi:hypothetical protein